MEGAFTCWSQKSPSRKTKYQDLFMWHLSKHIPVSLQVLGINSRPLLNHHLLAQHFSDKLPHLISTTNELNHLPEKVASVIGLTKAYSTRLQRSYVNSLCLNNVCHDVNNGTLCWWTTTKHGVQSLIWVSGPSFKFGCYLI